MKTHSTREIVMDHDGPLSAGHGHGRKRLGHNPSWVKVTDIEVLLDALKAIANDDGVWSDGDGLRDGDPAFQRVQVIAKAALETFHVS